VGVPTSHADSGQQTLNSNNTDKTVLGAKSINFDGFQISADGVRPIESHTRALRELKPPANVKELQTLLGAVGFYMKFMPH
jgi:hypothetical protein